MADVGSTSCGRNAMTIAVTILVIVGLLAESRKDTNSVKFDHFGSFGVQHGFMRENGQRGYSVVYEYLDRMWVKCVDAPSSHMYQIVIYRVED